MNYMETWNKLKQPPPWALKQIGGGRLKGMTDVNPQWRYQAMTEEFGMCGEGWKYEIVNTWREPAWVDEDGAESPQVFAFAEIKAYVKTPEGWSDPIPGIGGSMLVIKESSGLHMNDEAYKMAITDALSVALKMLGIGSDIYAGLWDGTKYGNDGKASTPASTPTSKPVLKGGVSDAQMKAIYAISNKQGIIDETVKYMIANFGTVSRKELTKDQASQLIEALDKG